MENVRAKFLVEKSNLTERDKLFLITHLEMYEEVIKHNLFESERLLDELDLYRKADSMLISAVGNLASLLDELYNKLCEGKETNTLKEVIDILESNLLIQRIIGDKDAQTR